VRGETRRRCRPPPTGSVLHTPTAREERPDPASPPWRRSRQGCCSPRPLAKDIGGIRGGDGMREGCYYIDCLSNLDHYIGDRWLPTARLVVGRAGPLNGPVGGPIRLILCCALGSPGDDKPCTPGA
jgi:hypothetical protein